MIQRYRIEGIETPEGYTYVPTECVELEPDTYYGVLCKWDDVEAELASMRKEIERLRGVIAERDDRLQAARIALNGPVSEAMRAEVAR